MRLINLGQRFLLYSSRQHNLIQELGQVRDGRKKAQIKIQEVLTVVMLGILVRAGSLNNLESKIKQKVFRKAFGNIRLPSADTIAYALKRVCIEDLRKILNKTIKKLRYNRSLEGNKIEGFTVAAFDGTGMFSTKSARLGKEGHKKGIHDSEEGDRYHEHVLAASYIGSTPLLLDVYRIPKGQGEVTAAIEVFERLYKEQNHFCDIITADALYAKAPFINAVVNRKMDVIIRVKQENYNIIKDIEGLCKNKAGMILKDVKPCTDSNHGTKYDLEIWDEEGLTSWDNVNCPLRCVRIKETRKIKQYGKIKEESYITYLVTTCPKSLVKAETIWRIAHRRWDIENAFHDLKTNWYFDHPYLHDANGLAALWLLFAITYDLFLMFYHRNIRSQQFKGMAKKEIAQRILAGLERLKTTVYQMLRQIKKPKKLLLNSG